MYRSEEKYPSNENAFILMAKYSSSAIKNYKENILPSILEKYSNKIDSNWNEIIKTYLKIEPKETSVYFYASFAPSDLSIGSTFNSVFNKNETNVRFKSKAVIKAILNEWTLLPVDSIPYGHRCICMIDFPEGVPSLINNMPEVEKVTNINQDIKVCLSNE